MIGKKRSPEIIQFNHVIGIQSHDDFSLESTDMKICLYSR